MNTGGRFNAGRFRAGRFAGPLAGGGTPAPVAVAFGALTLSGAAYGRPAPAGASAISGGTALGYVLSGGLVYPAADGSADGGTLEFAGTATVWEISTIADTYSVGDAGLGGVIALGGAVIDAKTVMGHPGADIVGANAADTLVLPASLSLATGLTVTSHDPLNPCFMRRLDVRHDGKISFSDVTIRDDFVLSSDSGLSETSLIRFAPPAGGGRSELELINCLGYGTDPSGYDASALVSGSAAAHAAGSVVTLSDNPDLSAIATDRSMGIRIGQSNRVIVGVDDLAKTVTVETAVTEGSPSSPVDYVIGYVPQVLSMITQQGGFTTDHPRLSVSGCELRDFNTGITGAYQRLTLRDTLLDNSHASHVSVSPLDGTLALDIENNRFGRVHGRADMPFGPDTDAVRFDNAQLVAGMSVPARIIGNVMFHGGGPTKDVQGIFLAGNGNALVATNVLIEHNVLMTSARRGIVVEVPRDGTRIRGNTVLYPDGHAGLPPFVQTTGEFVADGAATHVSHNICAFIQKDQATAFDNFEFGPDAAANEAADYAALLTGSAADFDPDTLAGFDAFLSAMTPDGNATLWPAGRTRVGALGGYYDYASGVSDAPWDETGWSADVAWGDLTGQAAGAPVTSARVQVTGVSPSGTDIQLTGGPDATLTLYDTDASTVIVSGVTSVLALDGQWVEIHDIASASGGTTTAVSVVAGAAAGGTWSHTTQSIGFSANAVEFDGTDDYLFEETATTASPAASKKGFVSFWLYVPTVWPTSGAIFNTANAAGKTRVDIKFASSGRMSAIIRDASETQIMGAVSATNSFLPDRWYFIAVEFDTTGGVARGRFTRDDGIVLDSTTGLVTDAMIEGGLTRIRVGASGSTGNTRVPNCYLSELFVMLDDTPGDMTIAANREKFRSADGRPVDLGSDGSVPTGNAPWLYYANPAATWHEDVSGSANTLTVNGTLAPAPSSPSD